MDVLWVGEGGGHDQITCMDTQVSCYHSYRSGAVHRPLVRTVASEQGRAQSPPARNPATCGTPVRLSHFAYKRF